MECNKEEAIRAMDIAKRKVTENDYNGAKTYANKAQNLYPQLDGLKQVLMLIDVYISAGNKLSGGESDWYGILGVDPLAADEVVKKQYKKLALLLHPDKNKCKGAEDAFKLVLEAWSVLSDKVKRIAFDQKRTSKEVRPKKSRKPRQPRNQQKQPANQPKQPANQKQQPANQQKQPENQKQQPPNQPKQPANQQKQPPNQKQQPPNQKQQPPNQQKQPENQKQQPPNQPKQPANQQKQPPNQKQQPANQQKQPPNQPKQPPNQPKQPPNEKQQPTNQQQQTANQQKQPPNQPSSNGFRNGRGRSNKPTSKVSTFLTMCNKCRTQHEYVRVYYLNKTVLCRNCHGSFKATENEKTASEKEETPQATNKNTHGASCGRDSLSRMASFNSGNVTNQPEERVERVAEESEEAARGIANSDFKVEERVLKKLRTEDCAEASSGIKV